MNDIADTGGSASRPLRKIVSLRREQDRRSFFRALMLCSLSRATFVMWSRAEKKRCIRFVADT